MAGACRSSLILSSVAVVLMTTFIGASAVSRADDVGCPGFR